MHDFGGFAAEFLDVRALRWQVVGPVPDGDRPACCPSPARRSSGSAIGSGHAD
jgi:hypothetical protein